MMLCGVTAPYRASRPGTRPNLADPLFSGRLASCCGSSFFPDSAHSVLGFSPSSDRDPSPCRDHLQRRSPPFCLRPPSWKDDPFSLQLLVLAPFSPPCPGLGPSRALGPARPSSHP